MADSRETILVVDFGAQYAQLIARRVREVGTYSEIVPHDVSVGEIASRKPKGLVLSGGPKSVNVPEAPSLDTEIYDLAYDLSIPILGICYGAQRLARDLGGEVDRSGKGEYGRVDLRVLSPGKLFSELFNKSAEPNIEVWMSHFDSIVSPPQGSETTATTDAAPVAAFENPSRGIFGVQFHPEVVHTPCGAEIMERFVTDICGCNGNWTISSVIDESIAAIQSQVGPHGKAICGLSGGVDSAVAAALAYKALGRRLTCVFVDTGLLRKDEGRQVVGTFQDNFGAELMHIEAGDKFCERLRGVTDPEQKRKIIGELFIRTFEEAAAEAAGKITDTGEDMFGDTAVGNTAVREVIDTRAQDTAANFPATFLVQGTLYPDVIESGTQQAAKIKSHHNVGGLPDDLEFDLVEPLARLFKDEARDVGEALGLPKEIVQRQPFPGPGLGVRIIGEVTPEKIAILREADAIVRQEISSAHPNGEIWQYFAVLPDIRTVGVMGDERTYAHLVVVRAVTSEDAMTADWARLDHELLARISSRIINEVAQVNRVAYDITSKPPGTIEWE